MSDGLGELVGEDGDIFGFGFQDLYLGHDGEAVVGYFGGYDHGY